MTNRSSNFTPTIREAVRFVWLASALLAAAAGCGSDTESAGAIADLEMEVPSNHLSVVLAFSTPEPATPEVRVHGPDGTGIVPAGARLTAAPGTEHRVGVVGLRAEQDYTFDVSARGASGTWHAPAQRYTPGPLPEHFPTLDVALTQPDEMEPGFTVVQVTSGPIWGADGRLLALDDRGEVVWYFEPERAEDITFQRPTADGGYLFLDEVRLRSGTRRQRKIDFLGRDVAAYESDAMGTLVFHHEVVVLPNGNYLALAQSDHAVDYPAAEDGAPPTTYRVGFDALVEYTPDARVVREVDLAPLFPPDRISSRFDFDLTLLTAGAKDLTHANSIAYDPNDGCVVMSFRNQDVVGKIDLDGPRWVWVIGEDSPATDGDDDWPFLRLTTGSLPHHQHSAVLLPDDHLLVYDNGNGADGSACPPECVGEYSRAVEYVVDERGGTVTQVWEWFDATFEPRLFAPLVGSVESLSNGNVLISDSGLVNLPALTGDRWMRVVEVRPSDGAKVFDVRFPDDRPAFGDGLTGYRSFRVSSLYPPAPPG